MVLGWDFKYTDELGGIRETVTSVHLLDEVTYPVMMHNIIDDKTRRDDTLIRGLFYEQKAFAAPTSLRPVNPVLREVRVEEPIQISRDRHTGTVHTLKDGFGFIKSDAFPSNIFFHWQELVNRDFNGLKIGDPLTFAEGKGERGAVAIDIEMTETNH